MQSKHIKQAPSNKSPPKPVDVAKAAALRELSSKSFRLKTWSLSQLPNDFWNTDDRSTPGALQEFSEKGSITMRKLLFDELPLLVSASDKEWQLCPVQTTDVLKLFWVYLGGFLSLSAEHGFKRFKPWFDRHFVLLAKCILLAIRPRDIIKAKKRPSMEDDAPDHAKWASKRNMLGPALHDTTNLPAAPLSPPRYILDPSISLSPPSCKRRRTERKTKVQEARARLWAARRTTPEQEDAAPGPSARPPSVLSEAGGSKDPTRSASPPSESKHKMSISFLLN
ncbi:hypothetical protein B0H13DRAFT_2336324 [Mycena leptocephala]|nr:hypothetical protein B0H13DRAFT_2336324 [Mycena leptocephala]